MKMQTPGNERLPSQQWEPQESPATVDNVWEGLERPKRSVPRQRRARMRQQSNSTQKPKLSDPTSRHKSSRATTQEQQQKQTRHLGCQPPAGKICTYKINRWQPPGRREDEHNESAATEGSITSEELVHPQTNCKASPPPARRPQKPPTTTKQNKTQQLGCQPPAGKDRDKEKVL
jgi:hypothetical protein